MAAQEGLIAANEVFADARFTGVECQEAIEEAKLGAVGQEGEGGGEGSARVHGPGLLVTCFQGLDYLVIVGHVRGKEAIFNFWVEHRVHKIVSHGGTVGELQFGGTE
jgi:hypothetical protein